MSHHARLKQSIFHTVLFHNCVQGMLTTGREVDRTIMLLLALCVIATIIFVMFSCQRVARDSDVKIRSVEYALGGLNSRLDERDTIFAGGADEVSTSDNDNGESSNESSDKPEPSLPLPYNR